MTNPIEPSRDPSSPPLAPATAGIGDVPTGGQPYPAGWGESAPPPAPAPTKETRGWTRAALAVVLLVATIGGAAATLWFTRPHDPAAAPSPNPSTPSAPSPASSATPAPKPEPLPAKLAGLNRTEPAQLTTALAGLEEQLRTAVPEAHDIRTGVYADPKATEKLTLVIEVKGTIGDPEYQVDGMLAGLKTSGIAVTGLTPAPGAAGGGAAQCGRSAVQKVNLTVCAWGDDASIGMMIFYFRTVTESVPLFTKIRTGLH